MGHYDDPALTGRRRRPVWPILLALGALVAGLALGYLWRSATEPVPPASPPAPVAPALAPPPADVPSPCLAVAQRGTDVLAQLERAAQAVGALDPGALREAVDEVRRLRDQLQREVEECRNGLSGPASPAPTAPG